MARRQRENIAECNDHGSNPVQGTIFCFHFYCLRLTRLTFINPRNIISNIIMIFNINSTRGHTGSLLVDTRRCPCQHGLKCGCNFVSSGVMIVIKICCPSIRRKNRLRKDYTDNREIDLPDGSTSTLPLACISRRCLGYQRRLAKLILI